MFDYYTHVNSMNEDQLYQEVEKIYKKLFTTPADNPVYDQLLILLEQAEEALNDKRMIRQFAGEKDAVINIGEMESEVHYPKYDPEELLVATVHAYTQHLSDKKQNK